MEDLQTGAAEAVTESTAAPAVETTTTEAPASMEQTMEQVWEKLNPPRENNGQFKGQPEAAPIEAAPETETTDQAQQEAPGTAQPSTEAPNAWSAEEKALWAKVPPDAQSIIARRETEAHRTITQQGQQIAQLQPVSQVLERHRDSFVRNNVTPDRGMELLLAASNALDENPAAAIQQLAQQYGVDLKQIATGEAPQSNQELVQLRQHVRQLESKLTAREQAEQQTRTHTLEQTIESFANREDVKPYYADLEAEILAQLPGIDSKLAPEKRLEAAFEKAKWAHPTVRERILSDQRKADEEKRKAENAKQVAEAKKHQTLNQKAGNGVAKVKGSMEDTMREVADRLMPG